MLLWHRIEEIQMLYQDAFRDDAVGIRFVRLIVQSLVPFFFLGGGTNIGLPRDTGSAAQQARLKPATETFYLLVFCKLRDFQTF